MKLIFIGPQGSGKGTQAKIIAEKLNLKHLSTGDLLRNAQGKLKKEAESYMNSGKLVPDELIIKILKEGLSKPEIKDSFILDGFPRNLEQAEELNKITNIDKIIEISISDEESIKRLSGRWNCKKCGIAYNVITSPKPKEEGKCDKCQESLYQRDDDKPGAIKQRLRVYHEDTEPILEKYPSVRINGEQSIKKVTEDILKVLG